MIKPKFFLPGDKVRIKGEKGILTIETWFSEHTRTDGDEEYSNPDGSDYEDWEYATTEGAWYKYKDITFVEAGWMRKML